MFDYEPRADLLADRTILITGAGDGIGKAAAHQFARYGANVILTGRTESKLATTFDEIESHSPQRAIIHPLDLAKATEQDYKILSNAINEQYSHLDGLLHNGALLGPRSPIQSYPYQDWLDLVQVNINGAFLLTRELLPLLAQSDSGRILFTSSSVGRKGRAYWGAYSVTKFAIEGLMQVLADELENTSSIRVNSINPGGTRTKMRQQAYPAENPNTRPAPEALMPVYLYLMGEDSKNLHGKAIDAQSFDPEEC